MSSCHHVIMSTYYPSIMPLCHHAIMPSCHHTIMPSCHHVNMLDRRYSLFQSIRSRLNFGSISFPFVCPALRCPHICYCTIGLVCFASIQRFTNVCQNAEHVIAKWIGLSSPRILIVIVLHFSPMSYWKWFRCLSLACGFF